MVHPVYNHLSGMVLISTDGQEFRVQRSDYARLTDLPMNPFVPRKLPYTSLTVTNLLNLLTDRPLDLMTASEVLALEAAVVDCNITPNPHRIIMHHVEYNRVHICTAQPATKDSIIDALRLVRSYRSQQLLTQVLTNIVTGQWGVSVDLDSWGKTDQEWVGLGIYEVLKELKTAEGFAGAVNKEVLVTDDGQYIIAHWNGNVYAGEGERGKLIKVCRDY